MVDVDDAAQARAAGSSEAQAGTARPVQIKAGVAGPMESGPRVARDQTAVRPQLKVLLIVL